MIAGIVAIGEATAMRVCRTGEHVGIEADTVKTQAKKC
jgi:hypothetical protein